jgi:hypothetical protein
LQTHELKHVTGVDTAFNHILPFIPCNAKIGAFNLQARLTMLPIAASGPMPGLKATKRRTPPMPVSTLL